VLHGRQGGFSNLFQRTEAKSLAKLNIRILCDQSREMLLQERLWYVVYHLTAERSAHAICLRFNRAQNVPLACPPGPLYPCARKVICQRGLRLNS
jgi:hypothetical protein